MIRLAHYSELLFYSLGNGILYFRLSGQAINGSTRFKPRELLNHALIPDNWRIV